MTLSDWLTQVLGREAKATEGPWNDDGLDVFLEGEEYQHTILDSTGELLVTLPAGIFPPNADMALCKTKSNADFIAHARTDLPTAIRLLEQLQGDLETYGKHHTKCTDQWSNYHVEAKCPDCICGLDAARQVEVEE